MKGDFYQRNRERLIHELGDDGLVVVFGSSAAYRNAKGYYGRALDMNFFYLTGLDRSNAMLAVWSEHGKLRESLFIEKPDPDEEKWSGIRISAEEATRITGVEDVRYLGEFDTFLDDRLAGASNGALYLDIPDWFEKDVPPPIDTFVRAIGQRRPTTSIVNVRDVLSRMRMVKRPEEVECIRRAVKNAKAGIEAMMTAVKPGMYEYELQAVCYHLLHSRGEMKAAPMVAAGANATR